jgi:glycosyltransferase involved in cell wall biosynthesis
MAERLNMCMFYAAFPGQVFPVAKALEEHFNIDVAYLFDGEPTIPFEINLPSVNKVSPDTIQMDKYDIFFGFDISAIPLLLQLKQHTGKKVGCNILDLPSHTFIPGTRNYLPHIKKMWDDYSGVLSYLDFLTSWKEIDIDDLKGIPIPLKPLFHPVKPILYNQRDFAVKKQICYSGIVRPDKGVHIILEAISLADTSIKFLVLGVGPDLSPLANFLKVPYEQIPNCSDNDKYRHYYESSAIITFPDNPRIVSQCGLEGLAIGKPVIAADWPEARRIYGDFGIYAEPFNTYDLSRKIQMIFNLPTFINLYTEGAQEFCAMNRSNEAWASGLYSFLQEEKIV